MNANPVRRKPPGVSLCAYGARMVRVPLSAYEHALAGARPMPVNLKSMSPTMKLDPFGDPSGGQRGFAVVLEIDTGRAQSWAYGVEIDDLSADAAIKAARSVLANELRAIAAEIEASA